MSARIVRSVWLLLFVWQMLCGVSPTVVQRLAEDTQHHLLHEQTVAHHHADDGLGGVLDDAPSFHLHADAGQQPLGLDVLFAVCVVALGPGMHARAALHGLRSAWRGRHFKPPRFIPAL